MPPATDQPAGCLQTANHLALVAGLAPAQLIPACSAHLAAPPASPTQFPMLQLSPAGLTHHMDEVQRAQAEMVRSSFFVSFFLFLRSSMSLHSWVGCCEGCEPKCACGPCVVSCPAHTTSPCLLLRECVPRACKPFGCPPPQPPIAALSSPSICARNADPAQQLRVPIQPGGGVPLRTRQRGRRSTRESLWEVPLHSYLPQLAPPNSCPLQQLAPSINTYTAFQPIFCPRRSGRL